MLCVCVYILTVSVCVHMCVLRVFVGIGVGDGPLRRMFLARPSRVSTSHERITSCTREWRGASGGRTHEKVYDVLA